MRILLTGATGFLGQWVVQRALERGHSLVLVVRPGRRLTGLPWAKSMQVQWVEADLSNPACTAALGQALAGVDVVVHAAGAMSGTYAQQLRNTVEPTRHLLGAMVQTACRRLVLISSLSVYGYAALPDKAQLDEMTPLEQDLSGRDAYCRAKLAQEALAREQAQTQGMVVTTLRPGMIFGPRRLWSARLGSAKGPMGLLIGGHATLPLSYVAHCAAAVVLAAERRAIHSDLHVVPDCAGNLGAFEAINVIDDEQLTQLKYLALLRSNGAGAPRWVLGLPWRLLTKVAGLVEMAAIGAPWLRARLPGLLRTGNLHARFKPLRFSNSRLHHRLGWKQEVSLSLALHRSTVQRGQAL